jgi:hypothetical protein
VDRIERMQGAIERDAQSAAGGRPEKCRQRRLQPRACGRGQALERLFQAAVADEPAQMGLAQRAGLLAQHQHGQPSAPAPWRPFQPTLGLHPSEKQASVARRAAQSIGHGADRQAGRRRQAVCKTEVLMQQFHGVAVKEESRVAF